MSGQENVGVALALVFAAGASTAVGAAVVFFPTLVKLTSRKVLASALGFSAGVMCYVSFVEIFQKSTLSFEDAGFEDNDAYVYSTLCFFGGVILMLALNAVVSSLLGGHSHKHDHDFDKIRKAPKQSPSQNEDVGQTNDPQPDAVDAISPCACCSDDPVGQLEQMHQMADDLQQQQNETKQNRKPRTAEEEKQSEDEVRDNVADDNNNANNNTEGEFNAQEKDLALEEEEHQHLVHMGVNTAIAIGLHNFPEGLATFVAALDDPKVGGVLAVAIAIHNIPEGLCVALPIYYATGNRLKAFLWALLSGASEFVAALLGWAILANSFSDTLYASLFGLVAGMMVIISIRELLPTAHFYDPQDTVVTHSFIAGMALMAVSLVLFAL